MHTSCCHCSFFVVRFAAACALQTDHDHGLTLMHELCAVCVACCVQCRARRCGALTSGVDFCVWIPVVRLVVALALRPVGLLQWLKWLEWLLPLTAPPPQLRYDETEL